jgi:hypothetical protein
MSQIISPKSSVYKVAEELEKEASAKGVKALQLAQTKLSECRSQGDKQGMRFWSDVWKHALLIEQGSKDVQIIDDE